MRTEKVPAFSASRLAARLMLRSDFDPATDPERVVLCRHGGDHHADVYAVRGVVTDCTRGEASILVVELDLVGVPSGALDVGWRPGDAHRVRP